MREVQNNSKYSLAAKKAWETIRRKKIEKLRRECKEIFSYDRYKLDWSTIKTGTYRIRPPIIKKSKLASKEKGGVGKDLSEGWGVNFAIGCLHGCIFCYADQIHKRRMGKELSGVVWGQYFYIPENIDEVLEKTPWHKWRGKEVLMSATHEPYLYKIKDIATQILELGLRAGVRFCIQTRSPLVLKDIDLLEQYRDQIRLQVSIPTLNERFYRLIEPRVAPPSYRLKIIEEANERNIETGVIIAPVFPSNEHRPNFEEDLEDIIYALSEIKPNRIYGECLHSRGPNMTLIYSVLRVRFSKQELYEFDKKAARVFYRLLNKYNLKGEWWYEKCP